MAARSATGAWSGGTKCDRSVEWRHEVRPERGCDSGLRIRPLTRDEVR